ncbi:Uncharacterized conserved protein YkwD, contains CAP (CSP/antigen 5/PR1) domain [Rhizobiales bacterium GAS191]|jgi:uncharacterized protein YkwD|nr:Uncharacterized conserved protein YkwD, contains CAP (CSP/antigen 5/PR1) domain [Rhizobiales bacterium GAS113]SED95113.1 Uncharacterized conserved protein YkwD, contains CAP (CSP/antigen 5/PR1) domain [Rhizobiales bacterium GAS191]SEE52889.1 Uncharacterized conserved protein YkwD, contains CAP (CSP/antigen 5/PR1) domain [Rhizobiales bacterium GAS188]
MDAAEARAGMRSTPRTGEGGGRGWKLAATGLLLAVIAAGASGCAGLTGASRPVATRLVLASTAADARSAAALISRYRVANGKNAVSPDARLAEAAEVQARAVAAAGSLSHGDFASRMASFGIHGISAENLTAGRASIGDAIASWKASPGHNENLLLAGIHRIGVARIDTPGMGYGEYWALVLSQ